MASYWHQYLYFQSSLPNFLVSYSKPRVTCSVVTNGPEGVVLNMLITGDKHGSILLWSAATLDLIRKLVLAPPVLSNHLHAQSVEDSGLQLLEDHKTYRYQPLRALALSCVLQATLC